MKDFICRLLALLALSLASFSAFAKDITYSNPVLPGDFPDPSIIRVGDDYWATATSSEWGPLFPILHSRDLVNWELLGHVFTNKPAWSSKNYWAPEISYHDGKFYLYYVGRKNETNGVLNIAVASADKPQGPWTDHGPFLSQPEGAIDGMAFTLENGDRYLLWKNDGNSRNQPTMIWTQKLSEDGTKLVGERKELLRNDASWEGNLIEGPFAMKHGDWYYIFYAGNGCCGKACTYGVGVARSRNFLGPYEKNPANPIITANEKWRCPGHGSVVTTPDGRDYFIYHAYDTKDFVYVGRQGVLDKVEWNEDGWPVVNDGKGPSVTAVSPSGKAQRVDLEFIDDFTSATLSSQWQWPHSLEPQAKIENGELALSSPSERGAELFGSVAAVQTTTGNYAATTLVDSQDMKTGSQAGLFAFGDQWNALGVTLGGGKATLIRVQKHRTDILASVAAPNTAKAYLRLEAREGHRFRFFVWTGMDWKSIADADLEGDYLPPWDRGVRIALTAGGVENATAKFQWLRVVPKSLPSERAN